MIKSGTSVGDSINDFEIGEKIGYGGFAEVFKARCLNSGFKNQYVAIKKINKKRVAENRCRYRDQQMIKNEIEIHSQLPSDPSFVKFYNSFEDKKYWYLILELCAGGSLERYVKEKHKLCEEEAAKLIKPVFQGVQRLHHKNIIHRDLSLKNLLLTDSHEVLIADFGFAVKLNDNEKINTVLGTANFMAPEVFKNEPYDKKADCWSMGCILYTLLYGSPPFDKKKREDIKRNVLYSQLKFPEDASTEAKQLLESLLSKNPQQRPSLIDALQYPFFQKYEKTGNIGESQKRNGDSGVSSQSSCGSKQFHPIHTSTGYDSGLNHLQSQNERKSRHINNVSITRNNDNLFNNERLGYQNPISQKQRFECSSYQNRFESQYETPIKNRPECPSYPSELHYLKDRNFNTQIDHSSNNFDVYNYKHNNSSNYSSVCRQNSHIDNIVKDPTCSHNQCCPPDDNCCHKSSCCCRQTRNDACPPSRNFTQENKISPYVKNTVVKKCLKDIVEPLNTVRISSRQKEFEKKDLMISILNDGQVCLECFKFKKSKKYVHVVYLISSDGLEIVIYKPKKKILLIPDKPPPIPHNEPEVQYFTFENLPDPHWRKYRFAKLFVDFVRGSTPKVTIYGENAVCIMMENTPVPNYEMNFYNGCKITEIGSKRTIKDENGSVITDDDEMLREFENMKKRCIMLEKNIESFQYSNFPVSCGKKPDVSKRIMMQDNKENVSPNANGLNSDVRNCNITIGTENSRSQNTFSRSTLNPYLSEKSSISSSKSMHSISPHLKSTLTPNLNAKNKSSSNSMSYITSHLKGTSTPFSSEKSTSVSKNISNIPSYLNCLQVVGNYVIAEYKDGVEMYISLQDKSYFFKDTNTRRMLCSQQNPYLKERYENDSQDIFRIALLETSSRNMLR